MKYCTILYAIVISTVTIFCPAWGMDVDLSKSEIFSSGTSPHYSPSFSTEKHFSPQQETLDVKPLTKSSYLKFYESINNYLQTSLPEALENAQTYLRNSIDSDFILTLDPFSTFLEKEKKSATLEEINKVKNFLNSSYFAKNPKDLCNSIPFFLNNINPENDNTINDAINILDKLQQNTEQVNHIHIATVKRTIEYKKDWDESKVQTCLNLLDKICNFFPKKAFQKASYALQESQLTSLLKPNQNPELKAKIIKSISNNISTMIDFISKEKGSEPSTRINMLRKINDDIKNQNQYSVESIREWIDTVQDITETTLYPSDLMTSTLQLEGLRQEREELTRTQDQELKTQEEQENYLFLNDPDVLINNPKKLVDYLKHTNWNEKTKLYVLQLVFWYAYKKNNKSVQKELIKALDTITIEEPIKDKFLVVPHLATSKVLGIVHKRGTKTRPSFTYVIDQLPDDAPESLKILFNQFKKEELEDQIANPHLAIETYYKDIQKQQDRILEIQSGHRITPTGEFYHTFLLQSKSPEKITDSTKKDLESITKGLTIERRGQISKEQLDKLIAQNQKFNIERLKEKADIDKSFSRKDSFSEESYERIVEKISDSMTEKQKAMENLISEQVDQLNKEIVQIKDLKDLEIIDIKLKQYKEYVLLNTDLQKSIDQTIQSVQESKHLARDLGILRTSTEKMIEDIDQGTIKDPNILDGIINKLETTYNTPSTPTNLQEEARRLITNLELRQVQLIENELTTTLDFYNELHFVRITENIDRLKSLQEKYPNDQNINALLSQYKNKLETDAQDMIIDMVKNTGETDEGSFFKDTVKKYFRPRISLLEQYHNEAIETFKTKQSVEAIVNKSLLGHSFFEYNLKDPSQNIDKLNNIRLQLENNAKLFKSHFTESAIPLTLEKIDLKLIIVQTCKMLTSQTISPDELIIVNNIIEIASSKSKLDDNDFEAIDKCIGGSTVFQSKFINNISDLSVSPSLKDEFNKACRQLGLQPKHTSTEVQELASIAVPTTIQPVPVAHQTQPDIPSGQPVPVSYVAPEAAAPSPAVSQKQREVGPQAFVPKPPPQQQTQPTFFERVTKNITDGFGYIWQGITNAFRTVASWFGFTTPPKAEQIPSVKQVPFAPEEVEEVKKIVTNFFKNKDFSEESIRETLEKLHDFRSKFNQKPGVTTADIVRFSPLPYYVSTQLENEAFETLDSFVNRK